mgnify:CR=1 FL=1
MKGFNYPGQSPLKQDKKKKSYPTDYTDAEINKVVKRNMRATNIQSINELATRQDSIYSGIRELEKRHKKSSPADYKKSSPAKGVKITPKNETKAQKSKRMAAASAKKWKTKKGKSKHHYESYIKNTPPSKRVVKSAIGNRQEMNVLNKKN